MLPSVQKRRIPLEPKRKRHIRMKVLQLELNNRSLELELNSTSVLELGSTLVLELESTLVLELGSMLEPVHSKLERHRTCWPLWRES